MCLVPIPNYEIALLSSLLGNDQLMLTAGPNIAAPPPAGMVPGMPAPGMPAPGMGGQMMYGAGYPAAQAGYPQQY